MKRFLFLAIIVSVFGVGCQKEDAPVETPPASVNGIWELRVTQAGMGPKINYKPGEGIKWTFSNGKYTSEEKGKTPVAGTYTTIKDKTAAETVGLLVPAGSYASRIELDGKTDADKLFYQISNDTLYTLQGSFPVDAGVSKIYLRIK